MGRMKNAPSSFQRDIESVLREQIGSCFVYVDNEIIFMETMDIHVRHIAWV